MGDRVTRTVLINDHPSTLFRLSIADLQAVCARASERRMAALVVSGRKAGLSSREVVEIARDAVLSSDLLPTLCRECASLAGMFDIINTACGQAEQFFQTHTPPQGMDLALWLVGMDAEGNADTGR